MCGICLEDNNADSGTISCGHSFHFNCVMLWFGTQERTQGHTSCPMCRREPSEDDIAYFRLSAAMRQYQKKMAKGTLPFRRWFQRVRDTLLTFDKPLMSDLLWAPEFVPVAPL